ncbi:MAG: CPBP family intramembrane metalloprotease [Oscillospiraceae bacterium]|nr:CPBP family intramembrane metalloprotease [Oscillospiraceae bacterium]
MKKESIFKSIWKTITPMLGYFLYQIVAIFVVSLAKFIHISIIEAGASTSFRSAIVFDLVYITISAIIQLVLAIYRFTPKWKEAASSTLFEIGENKPIITATLIFVSFFSISLLLNIAMTMLRLNEHSSYDAFRELIGKMTIIELFIVTVIVAPIVEELCFRGIIFNRLLSWTKPWIAIIYQAAVFGIIHLNLVQGIYAFLLGFAIGLLYYRFRKLWFCILAHIAANFLAVVMRIIPNDIQESISPTGSMVILLLFIGLTIISSYLLIKQPKATPVQIPHDLQDDEDTECITEK